ncbi:MAG: hypothetical protein U0103_17110 [Candidatus Obscuribacterales bacterium]|nr:MAG: hypothetical protein EKK48_17425 [Candidatus Melainabacteria bacterium]
MKTNVWIVTIVALVSLGNLAAWFLYTPSHPDSAAIFVFPLLLGMGWLYCSSYLLLKESSIYDSIVASALGVVVSAVSFVAWFFREDSSAATLVLVTAVFSLIFHLADLIGFVFFRQLRLRLNASLNGHRNEL